MKDSGIYDVQSFCVSAVNAARLPATVRRAVNITCPTLCVARDVFNASLHFKRRKQYVLRTPPTRMKKKLKHFERKKRCFINKQRVAISSRHSSDLTRDLIKTERSSVAQYKSTLIT
ncbi:hypothetical protein B5X24_HaOG202815 [Helicoverpa armigera]|nr:hypothetical protein B5X24_HaOG202815 [Helicoverpa armigera]